MKKILGIALLIGLAALVGWRITVRIAETSAPAAVAVAPRPVPVALEAVRTMDLERVVAFTGTLEPRTHYTVAPKVSGRVEKLFVDMGDTVTNGQILAVLDNHEYEQDVLEAEAALQVARATVVEAESELTVARRDLKRSQDLRARNAVSQSELDQALAAFESGEARLQVAKAQVRQREAALASARVRLDYTRISARWEGGQGTRVVGERFVAQGDMVDSNDPIVSVVSLDEMLAVIHVIERDFPYIKPGQEAQIEADAYPGRIFAGLVSRVSPVLDENSRQARAEIVVPNPKSLLAPGMFVRARLGFATAPDTLAVPQAAVSRRDGTTGVFLATLPEGARKGTAHFVPFTPGIAQDGWVQITGKAAEELAGGRVVTLGKHLLEDGGAIALPKKAGNGQAG